MVGRLQDKHQHLLAADRVDLLAKDPLDPLHGPVAAGGTSQAGSSWRIRPARIISRWERASASPVLRRVGSR
jgi:hypothetical protein